MEIGRNDPCWCGSGKKWKQCHYPETTNKHSNKRSDDPMESYYKQHQIIIKNEKQIEGIRMACHLAVRILDATCAMAKEGVTTLELNDFAHRLHLDAGAIPAPLHYGKPPFPKSICTSLNDVICHGIPDKTALREGDIVNIDVTCILNGYYGDCSRMVAIGKVSPERQLVVDVAYESLMRSIAILKPGIPVSQVGAVIEPYANSRGCSVVNQFVGHGVGVDFHEGPQVPHCKNFIQILLVPGMTFTIEPMINAGVREAVVDTRDRWTARTRDGKASAQWEHTLLITEQGHKFSLHGKGSNSMSSKWNKELALLCHPYVFALKEGPNISQDPLDFSLLLMQRNCAEVIKSPAVAKAKLSSQNPLLLKTSENSCAYPDLSLQ